ncbi:MAG: lytic transglycosylase domain-containing protein [Marmoricola sp.]
MTSLLSQAVRVVSLRAARTLTIGVALGGVVVATVEAGTGVVPDHPAPAGASPADLAPVALVVAHRGRAWPGHPGRRVVTYRVRRGDSATMIAVRFHAWTAELLRINHKSTGSLWYAGEKVRVPVVVKRARGHHAGAQHHPKKHHTRHPRPRNTHTGNSQAGHPSRATVRDEIIRVARRYGVPQRLALAIAWQESGWQQHVRSSVGAVGAMQVMPGTGRWISTLVGRRLHIRQLNDNVVAGVVLFKLLRAEHGVRRSLAGYYQGLGSLQEHGTYPSTRRYVRSVLAHWRLLNRGWHPLQ